MTLDATKLTVPIVVAIALIIAGVPVVLGFDAKYIDSVELRDTVVPMQTEMKQIKHDVARGFIEAQIGRLQGEEFALQTLIQKDPNSVTDRDRARLYQVQQELNFQRQALVDLLSH